MVSGKLQRVNKIFLGIVSVCILWSCKSGTSPTSKPESSFSGLESGDIIYRQGNGLLSEYFRKTSSKEQTYSHAGIILIEEDSSVFVIHSEASEFTGQGGVKKESLNTFLNNVSDWALYRLDTSEWVRNEVVGNAMEYYEQSIPFDFEFNHLSKDKIYCTELIAVSVNRAMSRDVILPLGTFKEKKYYAIDDTYLINEMKLIKKYSEKF